jgi:hypothetical protein
MTSCKHVMVIISPGKKSIGTRLEPQGVLPFAKGLLGSEARVRLSAWLAWTRPWLP